MGLAPTTGNFIEQRIKHGLEFIEMEERIVAEQTPIIGPKEAKQYARQQILERAKELFHSEGVASDRIEQNVYDRKMVARRFQDYDLAMVSQLSWGVLQALVTKGIGDNYRRKLVALFAHWMEHENCPNTIPATTLEAREYCHHLTKEKEAEIDEKYLFLLEEQQTLLTGDQIFKLQQLREKRLLWQFEHPQIQEEEEEAPIVEEVEEEEAPIVEEVQEVAQPHTTNVSGVQSYSSFATNFNTILASKDAMVKALLDENHALLEQVTMLLDLTKKQEQLEVDYAQLFEKYEDLERELEAAKQEVENVANDRLQQYILSLEKKIIDLLYS